MLKLIGSLIVIASTGIMGFYYGDIFYRRVKQLTSIQYAINLLEAEIVFTSTPLSEAFKNVANKTKEPINKIFEYLSMRLMDKEVTDVQSAFFEALKKNKGELYFNKEEVEVLASFMSALGASDVEGQKKNFNITSKKLESLEKLAEESRRKNEKLFRYLGVCTGMLIVIILI